MMWYEDQGINSDVVLKCKMLVRRNIKGFAFPSKMRDAERQTVLEQVSEKADKLGLSSTKEDDKNLSKVYSPSDIRDQRALQNVLRYKSNSLDLPEITDRLLSKYGVYQS